MLNFDLASFGVGFGLGAVVPISLALFLAFVGLPVEEDNNAN